jgi:hypothetical protein
VAELETLHRRILSQVDELLAVADDPGPFPGEHTRVSGWSALEHAEHMARADDGSLHQLERAIERDRAAERGRGITLAGRAVLALGWIPRGVGKAPEIARPLRADRSASGGRLAAREGAARRPGRTPRRDRRRPGRGPIIRSSAASRRPGGSGSSGFTTTTT